MKGISGPPNGLMGRRGLLSSEQRNEYKKAFIEAFDKEIAEKNPKKVLISSEDMFLFSEEPFIETAAAFLQARFDDIEVLCSIRNPVDYIRGRFSTMAKSGGLSVVRVFRQADAFW
ncbi:MAG: hypothetical protein HRU32_17170 [Rhodobacteraceae bacterium]|nr:hypothetical protein [Paracoccaceae bacterium]